MTEAEWLACEDPLEMLDFLKGTAGERKLRLLGAAYCRTFCRLTGEDRWGAAVDMIEQLADGALSLPELGRMDTK